MSIHDRQRPRSLAQVLLGGSAAIGFATLIERGLGLLANISAARVGGAHMFGAYAIAFTTALNIASYAGANIGITAIRFSGDYPVGSAGYRQFVRSLAVFAGLTALLAGIVLWSVAPWFATVVLHNSNLKPLLRIASISAAGMLMQECLRGLLIGQRRFRGLFALSLITGVTLLAGMPVAARFGAPYLTAVQAASVLLATTACLLLARHFAFAPGGAAGQGIGPSARQIARFGGVQLLSVIGVNAAGWWIASLVARGDVSLAQMGFYSVAMQMRNVSSMLPQLISQSAYAQLSDSQGEQFGGADRVTLIATLASTLTSLVISGAVAVLMPWLLPIVYGRAFAGGELAATLAIATGLVHMSSAPAAARLTMRWLTASGWINGGWTIMVVAAGTALVPAGGVAAAMAIFLGAHIASALAVLLTLESNIKQGTGLVGITLAGCVGAAFIAALGYWRVGSSSAGAGSILMAVSIVLVGIWSSIRYAPHFGLLLDRRALATTLRATFAGAR